MKILGPDGKPMQREIVKCPCGSAKFVIENHVHLIKGGSAEDPHAEYTVVNAGVELYCVLCETSIAKVGLTSKGGQGENEPGRPVSEVP